MCTKIDQVYGWKTETESINQGEVFLYHEKSVRPHIYSVFDLQIDNS